MPNAFAYVALFSWPLVVAVLFARLPLQSALIWSVMGGYLLLPERTAVDFPMLPALDKTLVPSLTAALFCMAANGPGVSGAPRRPWLPASALGRVLIVAFLAGPFVTVVLNDAPTHVGGGVYLRGLSIYDAFSVGLSRAVVLLPFLLARRHLDDIQGQARLLRAFCLAGLLYSLPMLFEVRMSPQLNTWIYGFFPHDFGQQMRFGGFRPVVFIGHGLWVAIFCAMTLVAGVALWRLRAGDRNLGALAAGWLAMTLVLCKSVGALFLGLAMSLGAAFLRPRGQILVAATLAGIVCAYPALRGAGLVPVQSVLGMAGAISADRQGSIAFRIVNEDKLLTRANERPLFGWGGWGRSRVYDPATGADVSTTDGRWVIVIGTFGWVGYIAEFGLLTLPIFLFAARRRAPPGPVTAALCLVLCVNLLDLLPNATLTPLTWLLAGALLGRAERVAAAPERQAAVFRSGRTADLAARARP